MLSKDQTQEVREGGTAVQAGGDVTITQVGLSYAEVRDVALDVFRSNFEKLAAPAMETARARAEQITDEFLEKLQRENPEGLQKAQDPDFQYALLTVQKEFARNGGKDLGDLLVDLLVDRSKQEQRDILQIVLNESLATAPKLTDTQLAALAIIFLMRYTQNRGIGNHELLGQYFDRHAQPFASMLVKNQSCYQHLEFTGCGSIQMTSVHLEAIFAQGYQGLFLKGFDLAEITARGLTGGPDPRFFVPCLNDSTKLQVRAINKTLLEGSLDQHNVNADDRAKIIGLFDTAIMSHVEIREKCIAIRPYLETIFDVWSGSPMQQFTLTSVGMAIGHANIKRLSGEFASLSIWIN